MIQRDHKIFAAGIVIRQDRAIAEAQVSFQLAGSLHRQEVGAISCAGLVELVPGPGVVPILDRSSRLGDDDRVIRIDLDDTVTTDMLSDLRREVGESLREDVKVEQLTATDILNQ
jgi:hypothetical protein